MIRILICLAILAGTARAEPQLAARVGWAYGVGVELEYRPRTWGIGLSGGYVPDYGPGGYLGVQWGQRPLTQSGVVAEAGVFRGVHNPFRVADDGFGPYALVGYSVGRARWSARPARRRGSPGLVRVPREAHRRRALVRSAVLAIALLVGCKSEDPKESRNAKAREPSKEPLTSVFALAVDPPSGCTRSDKRASRWIEVKCEAGDGRRTFIHIAFSDDRDATPDAYLERRRRIDWKDTKVTVTMQDKLDDGWIAVFGFAGTERLVDSFRQIAGKSVNCGGSASPDQVDRVIATCKSVGY